MQISTDTEALKKEHEVQIATEKQEKEALKREYESKIAMLREQIARMTHEEAPHVNVDSNQQTSVSSTSPERRIIIVTDSEDSSETQSDIEILY